MMMQHANHEVCGFGRCLLRVFFGIKKRAAGLCLSCLSVRGRLSDDDDGSAAGTIVNWVHTLTQYTQGQSISCLLQVLGIAILSQFAADLCKESGLAAAASAVELSGRMLAMLQALPMLQSLVDSFLAFLQ